MAGDQHEPQLRRYAHQQQLKLALRIRRTKLVYVVDDQPDPVLKPRQVLQQALHDHPPVQVGRRRQRLDQRRPRRGAAQRVEHRHPEALRIALEALDGYPRGAVLVALVADPGAQQDRLPASWRHRHHGHTFRRP
jgi:hypothetical protein